MKKRYYKKSQLKVINNCYKVVCLLLLGLLIFSLKAYADKKTINVINKEIINPNIVMLGDSITDYYDLNNYYGEDKLIVNSGISGNRVDDILNNLKSRVYVYNPSKVFILIGINDILWDNANSDYVYSKTISIAERIHERLPNTEIYIESIYPYNDEFRYHYDGEAPDYGRVAVTIEEVNSKLNDYCENSKYVTYIDLYSKLINENKEFSLEYSDDGLHPNSNGYILITDLLKKYM